MSYPQAPTFQETWDEKYLTLTTTPRTDFYDDVVQPPSQTTPFRIGIKTAQYTWPSLGKLDIFAVETIQEIIPHIDLFTVTNLRRLNTRMRAIIDLMASFRLLAAICSDGLRTLNRTGAASYFTLAQVFQVMCTSACVVCGKHGTCLYMPECTRCCVNCIRVAQDLKVVSKTDAKSAFRLTDNSFRMQNVPVIASVPGKYTITCRAGLRKQKITSLRVVHQAALAVHGGKDALAKFLESRPQAKAAYKKIMRPGPHTFLSNPNCFMAATSFPFYDRTTRRVYNSGYLCKGCQIQSFTNHSQADWAEKRNETYTEEGFIAHFDLCASVQYLWKLRMGNSRLG